MQFSLSHFLETGSIISLDSRTLLIGWGPCKRFSSINELQEDLPAFYFPDFFLTKSDSWIQYSFYAKFNIQEVLDLLDKSVTSYSFDWRVTDQSIFNRVCKQLQQLFFNKELVKAVPYVFAHCESHMSPEQLEQNLKSALYSAFSQPGWLYGSWDQYSGILGFTPETLFQFKGRHLETMALAGTSNKDRSDDSFKTDAKELHEHRLVVKGIQETLSHLGKVKIGQLDVLHLASLNHLKTTIQVELNQVNSFESLVKVLHPTPALGTFPREAGWKWLLYYQTLVERGQYGAPAGVFMKNKSEGLCLVAIRNVQWNTDGQRIGAGCGFVKESQPEKEWQEINLKIKSVKNTLNL